MLKHLLGIEKIDRRSMIATCLIDFTCGLIYLGAITGGFQRGLDFEVPFWLIFFPFASGATMALELLLLRDMATRRLSGSIMPLLLIFTCIQALTLLVEIIFACVYGGFWEFGYADMAMEAMLGISYLRRYFIIKELRKIAEEGGE